jgi:RNA polymerase sigma-70 factor (ECF subfamily)
VLGYARRRLANAQDCEDVVVEVFAVAWRRRAELPEQPLPWLYATAAHVLAHSVRAEVRRGRLVARVAGATAAAPPAGDSVDMLVDQLAASADVAWAWGRLSEADQEVLRLWAWEGLDGTALGEALGCTAGTARTRLHRAKTRLRTTLAGRADAQPQSQPQPQPQPQPPSPGNRT